MITYLIGLIRPDIAIVMHQVTRFSSDPKLSYDKAVMRLRQYLRATISYRMFYQLDAKRGLELFVDTDFVGSCIVECSLDSHSVLLWIGYIICLLDTLFSNRANSK